MARSARRTPREVVGIPYEPRSARTARELMEQSMLVKSVWIAGGFPLLVANGAGPFSPQTFPR
jgi:hypothetical protein